MDQDELQAQILGMDVLGYPLSGKDILLVKRPPDQEENEFLQNFEALTKYIHERGYPALMFAVEDFEDLMILTVADMNGIGWYHKDQILMLKEDMPMFNQGEEE